MVRLLDGHVGNDTMGPIIIIDKSALQSLSQRECYLLRKYFYLNIPPVLIIEVLADLKKAGDGAESRREVKVLADKLAVSDTKFNVHCRTLLCGSLLGDAIPMNGTMVIPPGEQMRDENGQEFIFFEEPAEAVALRRWREERFDEAEVLLADSFRKMTRGIDLEDAGKRLREPFGNLKRCGDLRELNDLVETLLADRRNHPRLLAWLIAESGMGAKLDVVVRKRWEMLSPVDLDTFAPYGSFVTKALMMFYIGLSQGLIGTRSTNRIDLEYMMYLPFGYVFASRDAFHERLVPFFLRADQLLIDGNALKSDLARLADWREGAPADEVGAYDRRYGGYPPDWGDSLSNQLWNRYMVPRSELAAEVELMNAMPDEDRRKDYERLKPMLDAIAKRAKQP